MKNRLLLIVIIAVTAHASPPVPTDNRMNVDFADEYRASIVRSVGELYDLNFVIPATFPDGKISLRLRSATWKEILEVCLYGSGYTYVVKETGTIMIVPLDNDIKVVEVLNKKLDAEHKENESWRAGLIQLIKEGIVACDADFRPHLEALILNVNNSPQKCLEMLRSHPPSQALEHTAKTVPRRAEPTRQQP